MSQLTFEDVLKACAGGNMPKVVTEKGTVGIVTTIKDNGRYKGIAVKLWGMDYDLWFHESDSSDKRSRYIRDLKLQEKEPTYFEIESQMIESEMETYLLVKLLEVAKQFGYTHVKDNWGVNAYDEYTIDDAITKFKN